MEKHKIWALTKTPYRPSLTKILTSDSIMDTFPVVKFYLASSSHICNYVHLVFTLSQVFQLVCVGSCMVHEVSYEEMFMLTTIV